MKIISADERMRETGGIKGVIFGPAKIGKTSLLWTLDPESTLFVDLEAGGLSVQGWSGDSLQINDWDSARNLACLLGGPNKARQASQAYSQAHFEYASKESDPKIFEKYQTIFVDSITVASRLAFQWALQQPEATSRKTGNRDTLTAYGILGQEMIAWITQLQHIGRRDIWFVGLLDAKRDDCNRPYFEPQIEGSKTGLELPGIVDEVITMAEVAPKEGAPYRAFICQRPNEWGYPAGDRSGKLDKLEEPHLGRLMAKIRNGERKAVANYDYAMEA